MTPTARISDALAYAADQHRDQRRKGAEAAPYINHPIALLRILSVEAGIDDPDVLVAAALHDVIEDCSGRQQEHIERRRSEIRDRFGTGVLALVEALTDDKSLPKPERKRQQVAHAARIPHKARLVKLADKIANVRDIQRCPPQDWEPERIDAYFDWATEVVNGLRGTHAHLEGLFDTAHAQGHATQS
jgi:guanosine-3',5'-bis(diphosphate) 3'-pyrophosphohydrolase